MGTYGVYGIVHDGSVLSSSHHWDMYPSYWGWRLATEAFENRHQASVLGEASTQARHCDWSPEPDVSAVDETASTAIW